MAMTGNFIDRIRLGLRKLPDSKQANIKMIATVYGNIRVLDSQEQKPAIINVPDGPNVIEHHADFINELSKKFRVICFELPGFGLSYPSNHYDFSLESSGKLILNLMDILKVDHASLSFSCANGFFAMKAAEMAPHRFNHIFLAQTPSMHAMQRWAVNVIPKILTYPIIGQLTNSVLEKKFAHSWYKYALSKGTDKTEYQNIALHSLNNGGCFCLSSLVQGLHRDINASIKVLDIPSTLIWGNRDYTHRNTDNKSVREHLPNCEIIEFESCGHFPELENSMEYVELINERTKI